MGGAGGAFQVGLVRDEHRGGAGGVGQGADAAHGGAVVAAGEAVVDVEVAAVGVADRRVQVDVAVADGGGRVGGAGGGRGGGQVGGGRGRVVVGDGQGGGLGVELFPAVQVAGFVDPVSTKVWVPRCPEAAAVMALVTLNPTPARSSVLAAARPTNWQRRASSP